MTQSSGTHRAGPRILVVDDDRALARVLARIVNGLGVIALTAHSPSEAREVLLSTRVDVVVCDRHLGDADGLRVLRDARALAPRALRVLMSGVPEDEARASDVDAVVDDFLEKPFALDALRDALTRWLRHPGVRIAQG